MKNVRKHAGVAAVAMLCIGLIAPIGAKTAQAVASTTTTTVTVSDSEPRVGDTVTFTVKVRPTTFGSPITGNVRIVEGDSAKPRELCSTTVLTESDAVTHEVTATCTWIAAPETTNVQAKYLGDTNYTTSSSSYISPFGAIGITDLSLPRIANGASGTLKAWANYAGTMAFKVDGQTISGCASVNVVAPWFEGRCTYTLPASPATARAATKLFSVDFTPTSKSLMTNAAVKSFTPNLYYWPSGDNLFQGNIWTFSNASSKTPYVNANYVEIDHVFYKLNRSTLEAMVVGYDRFAGVSNLILPDYVNVTSASLPTNSLFVGTYAVTTIGGRAFWMEANTPSAGATLLRTVTLPSTLKILGDHAFNGQCGIASIELPDSVIAIGEDSFKAMNTTGGINGAQGYALCTGAASTGLQTLKLGAGLQYASSYPLYGAGNLQSFSSPNAPSELKALWQYRRSTLDQWQFTDTEVQNFSLHHPINAQASFNGCSSMFVYVGGLQLSILAELSDAWQYWAQGCLGGAITTRTTTFKPSRPAVPTVSTTTLTSATVSYSAPASSGGVPITSYTIQYSATDWATSEVATSSISSATNPYQVTGLTPSTAYKFRVIATNSVGSSIASESSLAATTLTPSAPSAPTIGTATVTGATSASVSFTAPVSDGGAAITSYTATSSPGNITGTFNGSSSGFISVTGLTQGSTYTFTVKATNSAGTSIASSASNAVVPQVLAGPVFTSNTITGSIVVGQTLTANPVATGVPSPTFTYQWKRGAAAIVNATNSTYTLVSADAGQSISVAVVATNSSGTVTNTSTATTPVPAMPQSITFGTLANVLITSRTGTLGVTAGLGRATSSSGLVPTYSSGTPALCSVSPSGVIQLLAVGSCSITASQSGNTNYGIAAPVTRTLVIAADVPDAPFINSVSTNGGVGSTSGSATVAITKSASHGADIDQIMVIATASGVDLSTTVSAGAGETVTGTITGLIIGTDYVISVKAHNAAGWSVATTYASAVRPVSAPYAVTQLRSSQNGPNQLTVNFTPPTSLSGGNFTSYQYFITPRGTSFSGTPTSVNTVGAGGANAPADPGYTFTGLTALTAYDVKIVVVTAGNGGSLDASTALLNQVPSAAPSAPTITTSQSDSQSVRISWRITSSNGSAITSYSPVVTVNGVSQTCTNVFDIAGSTCTISGLSSGEVVAANVTATNAIGISSTGIAESLTVIGVVGAPTSLVVTPGDGQLSIAFTLITNGDSVSYFAYSLDGINYVGLSGTTSPVVISGLTNGTSYTVYLKAAGSLYGMGSASASITSTPFVTAQIVVPVAQIVEKVNPSMQTVVSKQPEAKIIRIGSIRMSSNSYLLTSTMRKQIRAFAKRLIATDVEHILVYGHTDIRVGVSNVWLSQQRASAVAKYLRPLLSGKKMTIKWFASSKPVTSGSSRAALAKNRRVEIWAK
jgi:outer membrane protein OmpA-like peptidoglycan-associated protein